MACTFCGAVLFRSDGSGTSSVENLSKIVYGYCALDVGRKSKVGENVLAPSVAKNAVAKVSANAALAILGKPNERHRGTVGKGSGQVNRPPDQRTRSASKLACLMSHSNCRMFTVVGSATPAVDLPATSASEEVTS